MFVYLCWLTPDGYVVEAISPSPSETIQWEDIESGSIEPFSAWEPASIHVSGRTVGIEPIQELGVLQIVQIRSGNYCQIHLY